MHKGFLSTNFRGFKGSILIYGTCIKDSFPSILKKLEKGKSSFYVCAEEVQPSSLSSKFSLLMHKSDVKELTILSMDGSMHCLLLHLAAQRSAKETNFLGILNHYVIEGGRLYKIEEEAIKYARHLSMIQKMLEKT